jgi:hypothetical protein
MVPECLCENARTHLEAAAVVKSDVVTSQEGRLVRISAHLLVPEASSHATEFLTRLS